MSALIVTHITNIHRKYHHGLLLLGVVLFQLLSSTAYAETAYTGRFSMLGATAQADEGELGYRSADRRVTTADQQSLRLMLDGFSDNSEWSLHLKASRISLDGSVYRAAAPATLFRYRDLASDWVDEESGDHHTRVGYEFDRLLYRHRFEQVSLSLGRQPLDWGSGRFWQPLNVFGAFAPTDLDTDYKPGIDASTLDWYPSAFSSVTLAYVLAPEEDEELEESLALHYQRQVGTLSEVKLLAAKVLGNNIYGAAFESAWRGMGWRVEGIEYRLDELAGGQRGRFWIAGTDYQFDGGTLLVAEYYHNSRGAETEAALARLSDDPLVQYGLQPQLSREVLGVGIERDLTPLLNGGYRLLATELDDANGGNSSAVLHQLNFTYSVSNESDLLLSMLWGQGRGVDEADVMHSEFGHIPDSLTLRLRFYF